MTGTRDQSRPDGDWNHLFAEINDMHYVREGHGQPLILLHGWPEFWWGRHRNIPALATRFDVIAPDLRGFGDTHDTRARHAEPVTHARTIMAFPDALSLDRLGRVARHV